MSFPCSFKCLTMSTFRASAFDFRNGHIWGFDVPPVPVMCRRSFSIMATPRLPKSTNKEHQHVARSAGYVLVFFVSRVGQMRSSHN